MAYEVLPNELGVISEYANVMMTQEEADEFLKMILIRHPFIRGAKELWISVLATDGTDTYDYFSHRFPNHNYTQETLNETKEIEFLKS